jgi:outer membrane protein W
MSPSNVDVTQARNNRRAAKARTALISALLAVGSTALAPSAAQAQEDSGEYDWKLFADVSYVTPLSDSNIGGATFEASSEAGYELGIEWKPTDRFGFEATYLDAKHDVEVNGTAIGDISLRPWNFSMNFHIIDRNAFNWWVGPTVSYIDWSDVDLNGGGSLSVDSETAYGLSTGFAVGLGQSLAIQFGLRYLDASVEVLALNEDVSVDPLFANVGIALRF